MVDLSTEHAFEVAPVEDQQPVEAVGCTYSIFLQMERIRYAAEFVHPTRSDVRGLVYTAAYVPDNGETINSLSVGYAPGAFLAHLVFAPSFLIAAQQRPTSLALFGTPSGPGAWHALPSWYAVSAHDRAIDPALERFMAQRAGSTTVEFAAASHVGGLTHYRARFVKLIEQAVQATRT